MATQPAGSRMVKCVVVTPERAVLDVAADFVVLPMYDGELGVLPGRAPLIGRLGSGELRIQQGTKVSRYFVDGGFAQVRANVVTVLTQKAIKAEEINRDEAAKALAAAQKPAVGPEAQAALMKAQQSARAQLRIASRSGGTGQV